MTQTEWEPFAYDPDDWHHDQGDDEPGRSEPDCTTCSDTGRVPVRANALDTATAHPLALIAAQTMNLPLWMLGDVSPTRDRANRRRCAFCRPSPRQRRRRAHAHRLVTERFARDVAAGRAAFGESPF